MSSPAPPSVPPERPAVAPLTAAAWLVALEACALVLVGLSLVPALRDGRLSLGLTSIAFFLLYGGFLGLCARHLLRRRSWARAPVVLAQLIQLPVGASFWGGATTPVAVALVLVAVAVLAGIFHPASLAALAAADRAGAQPG